MSEKYRKMEEKYTDACQMFGEDGKKIEPSEFFRYFQDFVTMYFVSDTCLLHTHWFNTPKHTGRVRQRGAIFHFSKANKSAYNRKLW